MTSLKEKTISPEITTPGGPAPKNDIEIVSDSISNISASGFDVEVNYNGDDDGDATAIVYFCNETDNPGCDPMTGTPVNLTNNGDGTFSGGVTGLTAPYDLGDDISYVVVVSDSSGVTNPPTPAQVTLNELRPIFRSVGVNSTTALASGAGNNLTISAGVASFSVALAENIGVGDAIQYDANNDGTIDTIMFIHGRTDSQNYTVRDSAGAPIADMLTPDNDWSIFRAYTSLHNAEDGTENTGLDDTIENFDTWVGGYDLLANNHTWNIALYADGFEQIATGTIEIDGWVTGETNFLKVYTPKLSSEVGVSQRHNGGFDTNKYYIYVNAAANATKGLTVSDEYIILDGLQVFVQNNGFGAAGAIHVFDTRANNNFRHEYKNNILLGQLTAQNGHGFDLTAFSYPDIEYRLSNNIVANFPDTGGGANSICYNGHYSKLYAYNNTAYNCNIGFRGGSDDIFQNNLLYDSGFWTPTRNVATGYNINNGNESTGALTDQINKTIVLNSPETHDYRLSGESYAAISTAVDLTSDAVYPITQDIMGNTRSRWDVGASTAATAVFRSIGPTNTASLQNGAGNDLNITINADGHSQADFNSSIASNIGVGDVIQYDPDNTGGVDAIAFISQRIDAQSFIVKNNLGLNAPITSAASQSWDIFRAYTTLAGAEAGTNENTGINGALQDFDTWMSTSGTPHDLISANQQWNLALYGDGTANDVLVQDWNTSKNNFLKLFAPRDTLHVGMTQRHNGIWDKTKARISSDNYFASLRVLDLGNQDGMFITEGIQVENDRVYTATGEDANALYVLGASLGDQHIYRDNIFRKVNGFWGTHEVVDFLYFRDIGTAFFINNIVYGGESCIRIGYGTNPNALRSVFYNNTCVNNSTQSAFSVRGDAGSNNTALKNNIIINQGSGGAFAFFNYTGDSAANVTDDATSPDGAAYQGSIPMFFNLNDQDFRLMPTDTVANGQGVDLSSDLKYAFNKDITGRAITNWDVGPFSTINNSDNDTMLDQILLSNISTTGFDVALTKYGDNNDSAIVVLFYCNATDNPGCNALLGPSRLMSCVGNTCSDSVSGLTSPNDPGDILNLQVAAIDGDGVTRFSPKNKVVLASSGVLASLSSLEGLEAYYTLDENPLDQAANATVNDSSGNGNVGAITTAEGGTNKSVTGLIGQATSFDGSDDIITVTNSNSLTIDENKLTLMAWVYPTGAGTGSGRRIISKTDGVSADDYSLFWSNINGLTFRVHSLVDGQVNLYSTIDLTQNKWSHVAGVWDGTTARLYLDGVEIDSAAASGLIRDSGNNLSLGNHLDTPAGRQWLGHIDEASIWSRALSVSEIQNVYNQTRPPVLAIYRSIGSAAALASGAGNDMTISGSTASFASAIADNVGVGDVIQYDANNDGTIDALMFISARTDSQNYSVQLVDGTPVADMGTADQDWIIHRAYDSLGAAAAGSENLSIFGPLRDFDAASRDLVALNQQVNIAIYEGLTQGTNNVGLSGWTATSAENFVRIYSPHLPTEVGVSQRHEGYFDPTKPYVKVESGLNDIRGISLNADHFLLEGLQVLVKNNGNSNLRGLSIRWGSMSDSARYEIKDSVFVAESLPATGTTRVTGIDISPGGAPNAEVRISNNIFINFNGSDCTTGSDCSAAISTNRNTYIYNNTFSNSNGGCGVWLSAAGPQYLLKNNVFNASCSVINPARIDAASSHNAYSEANNGEASSPANQNFIFKSKESHNYLLSGANHGIRGLGVDLSSDADYQITDDIKGNTRTRWDIGANTQEKRIFRSVGPGNTTALEIGTGNDLVIASSIATFNLGLSDSVGIGDAIQYDSDGNGSVDRVIFISGRVSSFIYNVQNIDGSAVADLAAADQDWSIYRAYTSFSNAESGVENTGLDNAIENFDTWTGGRDLVTNQEEWVIALYADAVETTRVTIDGWTTSPHYNLTMKTPNKTYEVGASQRHIGKWGRGYQLVVGPVSDRESLFFSAGDYILDGLQVSLHDTTTANPVIATCEANCAIRPSHFEIHNSIIRNLSPDGIGVRGLNVGHPSLGDHPDSKYYIHSNIIYGGTTERMAHGIFMNHDNSAAFVTHNTVAFGGRAITRNSGDAYIENNLAFNFTNNDFEDFGGGGAILSFRNNASSDASAGSHGGSGNRTFQDPTFLSGTNEDFRLYSDDTDAKNFGISSLYTDSSLDIEGNPRVDGAIDIGAHEASTLLYRSVGPGNTSSLASGGSNDLTISSGVATFSFDIPVNVGVGDAIQYDSDNNGSIDALMFIHGRIDAQNYTVRNADGATPGDMAVIDNDWDIFRAYTSLANANSATENTGINAGLVNFDSRVTPADLIASDQELYITLYGDAIDATTSTTSVRFDGFTTGPSNRLRIFTPQYETEVGMRQRHEGRLDTRYYTLEIDHNFGGIMVSGYSSVEGVQFTSDGAHVAVAFVDVRNAQEILVDSNIATGANDMASTNGAFVANGGQENFAKIYFTNNTAFNITDTSGNDGLCFYAMAYADPSVEVHFYNNTAYGCENGFQIGAAGGTTSLFMVNNLSVNNNVEDYRGTNSLITSSNNLSSDTTSPDLAYQGRSVSFMNDADNDFRLSSKDTDAKNQGTDLSPGMNFDNAGHFRGTDGTWDIGAHEAATEIFRSVGPGNITPLALGGGNDLTINNSIANFSGFFSSIVGVGDAIQYDRSGDGTIDSIMFIHRRIDSQNFQVANADGSDVTNMAAADQDWRIYRAYTSLIEVEAATENTGIDDAVENFDTYSTTLGSPHDLYGENKNWNFAFYADNADSGTVTFDYWKTFLGNEVRIFVPSSTQEVGLNQRHEGIWNSTKARYVCSSSGVCIRVLGHGFTFEGLQVENQQALNIGNVGGISVGGDYGYSKVSSLVKGNIVRSSNTSDNGGDLDRAITVGTRSHLGAINIVNNLAIDFGVGIYTNNDLGTYNVFNNTAVNNNENFKFMGGAGITLNVVNNIAQTADTTDFVYFPTPVLNENNISSDATANGTGAQTSTTVTFLNANNEDYRLGIGEANATNNGSDLSTNPDYPFNDDIRQSTRAQWDIGAFAYIDYTVLSNEFDAIGDGTPEDPYQLFNKEQLKDIGADPVNGCSDVASGACEASFAILVNIDLQNESYTPIGGSNTFNGTFDGNGNTVSNLLINNPLTQHQGFFGQVGDATISNLNVSGSVTGSNFTGLVVGLGNAGTYTNITGSGTVGCTNPGDGNIGGLFGRLNGADVDFVSSSVDVNASVCQIVGGLIGTNGNSDIDDSFATGDVSAANTAGGFIGRGGYNAGSMDRVYATGDVTCSGSETGGLIGDFSGGDLNEAYSTGSVQGGSGRVGGLVGYFSTSTATETITNSYSLSDVLSGIGTAGGLVGEIEAVGTKSISTSWAAGDVKAVGDYVGGFIGLSYADVSDSYGLGRVETDGAHLGGFIGRMVGATTRCFATGEVVSNGNSQFYIGGLTGYDVGTITDSYAKGNVYAKDSNRVGGLVGYKSLGTITRSNATGNVYSEANMIGGLVGSSSNTTVEESYARGSVTGNASIGGLIGQAESSSLIQNNFSSGKVKGSTNVGGLIGLINSGTVQYNYTTSIPSGSAAVRAMVGTLTAGTFVENYWDSDLVPGMDGSNISASVVDDYEPMVTAQLFSTSNLSGVWDFSGTGEWTQLDGRAYPIHKNTPEGWCVDNPSASTYNANAAAGTLADPYVICNSQQLKDLPDNACGGGGFGDCDKIFVQGADIQFKNDYINRVGGQGSSDQFRGRFDGRGHSLSNYFDDLNNDYRALFAYSAADIMNMKLRNMRFENNNSNSAFLVGISYGTNIHNVELVGSRINVNTSGIISDVSDSSSSRNTNLVGVKVYAEVGDVSFSAAGIMQDASTNTYTLKTVFAGQINATGNNVGGIAASRAGQIHKSKSYGSLVSAGGGYSGGIAGSTLNTESVISQVYSSMDVSANGINVGGIVGFGTNVGNLNIIEDSYSLASTIDGNGVTTNLGGITGRSSNPYRTYAQNNVINAAGNLGGIKGGSSDPGDDNYWDTTIAGVLNGLGTVAGDIAGSVTGRTPAQLDNAANFNNWDFNYVWAIGEDVRTPRLRWELHPVCQANMTATTYNAIGAGTTVDPRKICFKEQLMDLAVNGCGTGGSSGCSEHYQIMNDIDLKGETFVPISFGAPIFSGYINGNNHTIYNLYINEALTTDVVGFIQSANPGTDVPLLDNLNFVLGDVTGGNCTGGVIGTHTSGVIRNVHFSGTVTGGGRTGGLVGCNSGGSAVYDSTVRATVARVSGGGPEVQVGGFVGLHRGKIYNSHSYGTVTSASGSAGGFVGTLNDSGDIYDSSANVTVTAASGDTIGGFVGGMNGTSVIYRCSALGDVTDGINDVGGFVGRIFETATIRNSYSLGSVNASGADVGGFAGSANNSGITLLNNYSAASSVSGGSNVHAFASNVDVAATLTNNYWDNDLVSDTDDAGRYNGLTTLQMESSGNYTGWDFTNTWRVFTGERPEHISNK